MKRLKTMRVLVWVVAAGAFSCGVTTAQLPSLSKQPFIGYYAGYATNKFQIGLTGQGEIHLLGKASKKDFLSRALDIKIQVGIEETRSEGKATMRELKVETLTAEGGPTDELEKVTMKGKVTGDAAFELYIERNRDVIYIGGRMTDPGTLTKNPTNFGLRVKSPNLYKFDMGKDKEAKIAERAKRDELDMRWLDEKRVKQSFLDPVDATSKDLNGPGIASIEYDASAFKGLVFQFTASPNSSMTLWNSSERPLHEGFSINWKPDAEKDKDGKARLAIQVK